MDNTSEEIDVVDILVEFLEVSIHQLLFLRGLYPQSIFVLRKMYNIPVHVSKHPDLNNYISESLRSVRELVRHKVLKSVAVCFFEGNRTLERYTFNILQIQEKYKLQHDFRDAYLVKLREGMRACCLRMSTSNLKPLTEKNSFQIQVLTTEQGSETLATDPTFEDFPWIELEPKEKDLGTSNLLPLRTIEADFLTLQLYRETPSI